MSDEAPPRLDVDADVPEMAARALRAARDDVPDEDHLRRVEGLLMARLALGVAGGGGSQGSSGAGNPGTSGPPPATGGAVAGGAAGASASTFVGAGLAVAALVCGGLLVSYFSGPASSEGAPPLAPASVEAPREVLTPPSAFVPPAASATSTAKVVSIDDLPLAPPTASAVTAPTASGTSAKPGPVDSREEVQLLSDAQKTLRSDPATTLRVCNEHAKKFPGGALAQERDSLAIEALVSLGRKPEARARLARFREAYPGSGHLRKLDALF